MSFVALRNALATNRGGPLPPQILEDVEDLVFADGRDDDVSNGLAVRASWVANFVDPDGPAASQILRAISDLASNSYLWVALEGLPGERRVVKLCHAITLGRPPAILRATDTEAAELSYGDADFTAPVPVTGRVMTAETLRRWVRPAATSLGWSAYQIAIDQPAFRGSHSYHMQLQAADGLVIRSIGSSVEVDPLTVVSRTDGIRAHFYLMNADVDEARPITVAFRAERRGFLNLALAAAALSAAGLWIAQARVHHVSAGTGAQVAAAVLLVLPALLAVLVIRQTEHPLVTRLLAGVRGLLMLSGLASVAAAAALAGIRPGFWQTVSEAWIWCSSIASAVLGAVSLSWLVSWSAVSRRLSRLAISDQRTYLARLVVLCIALFALLIFIRIGLFGIDRAEPLAGVSLAAIATAALSAAAMPLTFRARVGRGAFGCAALVGGLTVLLEAGVAAGHREALLPAFAVAVLAAVFLAALAAAWEG